ncbi:MAG TPA: hypothetical protein VFF49_04860 [Thermodesulfobacteriota bacterium]|nr:hypothetical protein [Thermodesulfobacteriota bacterium]
MDPITIGLLAGGGLGLLKGITNEKKMKQAAKFREAALRYSPWTGMNDPGDLNLPGALSSGLQGAALGGLAGGLFPTAGATPVAGVTPYAGSNYLGGSAMNTNLGAVGSFTPMTTSALTPAQAAMLGGWSNQIP